MDWPLENILSHPMMELSLKQLFKERDMALEHNRRVSAPDYQFKGFIGIKIVSIEAIDKFIRIKEAMLKPKTDKEYTQLKLF